MGFIKRLKWHKVADNAADLKAKPGSIIQIEIQGKAICMTQINEKWFGFASQCPHAGAPMTDAYLDGSCRVICPVHSLKFDLNTGRETNGDGYRLKTYPVELREDGVYVGFEEGGLLKWL